MACASPIHLLRNVEATYEHVMLYRGATPDSPSPLTPATQDPLDRTFLASGRGVLDDKRSTLLCQDNVSLSRRRRLAPWRAAYDEQSLRPGFEGRTIDGGQRFTSSQAKASSSKSGAVFT